MTTPHNILGQLPGGRVLDLATGAGNFVHFLLEGLPAYSEIIGVDNNERAATAFAAAFKAWPTIHFELMDATRLNFEPASFDLVCLSNSLHHFDNPEAVLRQMERVLRPGGHLLISEMYRDNQTETQLTHVYLHHWWAAVDRFNGVTHHETYQRQGLVELVTGLGLENLVQYDLSELESDPKDSALLAELDPVFEHYRQRAAGHPELQARGVELRQRVLQIGFHSATTLIILGQKRK